MRRVPSSLIAVNLDGRTATPIRDGEITGHKVTIPLAEFAAVWNEFFPA
jgi:hypothetical protein